MAVKTDINHLSIDVQELSGATRVISTAAWYNNFRYWCCCGIEIVADANQSDATGLYLYAHVFDWIDSRHSGSVASFYPYVKYDGTQYDSSHISLTDRTHQIYSTGGSNKIFTDGTSNLPWEYYFPLGKFSSGLVSTKGAQTGWMPVSGGAWSGAEGRSDGTVGSPVSATYTIQTVTVLYDSNGGNGSVQPQSRVDGWTGSGFGISLAENSFSRTNYAFVKWNTAADGSGTDYSPGDTYTGGSITLYAIWRQLTSTITYNANKPSGAGGTVVVPATQTKDPGVSITLSSSVPDGSVMSPPYNFVAWDTQANGQGTRYNPGDSYSKDVNMTLYAVWESDYTKSIYDSQSVKRVDSQGNYDVTGEFLKVEGAVRIYPIRGQHTTTPSSLMIQWTSNSTQQVAGTYYLSPSDFTDVTPVGITEYKLWGFSWTSSSAVLSSGDAYGVVLDFYDTYMVTYGLTPAKQMVTIPVAFVTFSTNARGKSAAFGHQAAATVSGTDVNSGRLDVYMNTYFHGTTNITPALATSSTPGIVQPDTSTITVNNGVISINMTPNSGGMTKEDVLLGSAGSTGWREEKYADGRLIKWVWGLYAITISSVGYGTASVDSSVGTNFMSRPDIIPSIGPAVKADHSIQSGWWVHGGISNYTLNGIVLLGVRLGGNGNLFCEVRLEGYWQ